MKSNKIMALGCLLGILILLSVAFITTTPMDAEDNSPHMDVGTEVKFSAGTGHTTHGASSDQSKYAENSKVTLTLKVLTVPSAPDKGWDEFGTLAITDIEFSESSDLIYVPSYILDKEQSKSEITVYKVISIDDRVMDAINDRTISIVLPQALKSLSFSEKVTKVAEGVYKDSKGIEVHYMIDETAPAFYNGFAGYATYAYATDSPDIRYCEVGHVTRTVPADADYETKTVQWSKNDLVSCDLWVCGSFPDMLATVLTYELTFSGHDVKYSDESVRCATNAVIHTEGNKLTVNGFTVTANSDKGSATFEKWNVSDGQVVTSDLSIEAIFSGGSSNSDDSVYVYTAVIVIIVLVIVAGALYFRRTH